MYEVLRREQIRLVKREFLDFVVVYFINDILGFIFSYIDIGFCLYIEYQYSVRVINVISLVQSFW